MKKNFYMLCLLATALVSCKKDKDDVVNPPNPNENEMITTVKLIFTDASDDTKVTEAVYKDLSGKGVNVQLDTIRLDAGKTYHTELLFLDQSKNPVDTISQEVEKEGDAHQVFYNASSGANTTFTYADVDKNGVPIGILTTVATTTATADKKQTVRVVLKHQGTDKPKTGNGNSNLGSTDVEVTFPIVVK